MNEPSREEIERQVEATRRRPLHVLPASWWDQDVAERISEWMQRHAHRRLIRRAANRRSV
jgi:L-arabinose isomerase